MNSQLSRRAQRMVTAAAACLLSGSFAVGCTSADSSTEQPVATAPPIPPSTTTTTSTTLAPTTLPPTTIAVTTTTELTTTTEAATTTTLAPAAGLPMRADGVGSAFFGADPDGVVAYIESILGAPTSDTGWVTAFDSPFGVCPGSQVRGVAWFDLTLLFSDATEITTGASHFFHFQYGAVGLDPQPLGMATDVGLTVGSSVLRLRELYPDVQIFDDELYGPTFAVTANGLTGYLSAASDDGRVTTINGGQTCGE